MSSFQSLVCCDASSCSNAAAANCHLCQNPACLQHLTQEKRNSFSHRSRSWTGRVTDHYDSGWVYYCPDCRFALDHPIVTQVNYCGAACLGSCITFKLCCGLLFVFLLAYAFLYLPDVLSVQSWLQPHVLFLAVGVALAVVGLGGVFLFIPLMVVSYRRRRDHDLKIALDTYRSREPVMAACNGQRHRNFTLWERLDKDRDTTPLV